MSEVAATWFERIRACKTRDEAARVYTEAISAIGPNADDAWREINAAVMAKWPGKKDPLSGLSYVKERAWKLLA